MFGIKRILKHELDSMLGKTISLSDYKEMFSLDDYDRTCQKDDEGFYNEINGIKVYMELYKTLTLCLYFIKDGQKYFYIP